jgi:hypothetical protein
LKDKVVITYLRAISQRNNFEPKVGK